MNIPYKGGSAKALPEGGFLFRVIVKLLKIVLCLVRIFQVNDLGYLKARPKVGFSLSL